MNRGDTLSGNGAYRCETSRIEARAVLAVGGDLDLASAPRLLDDADAAMADPTESIALDLGAVTFVDSSGLTALLRVQRNATERGIAFTLGPVPPQVRRVIDIAGLGPTFGLSDSD